MGEEYKIKFDISTEVGSFSKDEIKASKSGGTDALIVFSLLYPEDGSFSMFHFSFDGRNKGEEVSHKELFKIWAMLTSQLSKSESLSKEKKEFCKVVFDTIFLTLKNEMKDFS